MRTPTILDAYALGAAPASVSSNVFGIGDATSFNLQVIATGTLVAGLTLKSSNDGVNFDAVTDVALSDTASAGSKSYDLANINAKYLRVDAARTGGSGNLTLIACVKGNV